MTISVDLHLTLTTAQRNAWNTIRPVIKSALMVGPDGSRVIKAYRRLREKDPDLAASIRQHTPWLDAVLDMIGEP
jgi:hypothetical protein